MELELARWLVGAEAAPALAAAQAEPDPDSVGAAERLRRKYSAEQAAVVLTQTALRRRAAAKFGERAGQLFFTSDGLQQATRAEVARWRAERFVSAGAKRVVDVGCGIGADALAFVEAGLEVVGIEADPVTAVLAAANLGPDARVICGDATGQDDSAASESLDDELAISGTGVFVDPARRDERGRTWRVADFTPPWDFATNLLVGRVGCLKAAPGLPRSVLPEAVATAWVSHRRELVETSLWSGVGDPGSRTALILPGGAVLDATAHHRVAVGAVGRYLYEPDPAVIRSGAISTLADLLQARAPQEGIAYLFAGSHTPTPFATAFEVIDELAYDERTLRTWVRDHSVGTLEIKTRGIDVDPAVLRRRLKPKGKGRATLVLTPTRQGSRALVVRRLAAE